MNAWLYPISRKGTHTFRDAEGKKRPTSLEAIRDAVEDGTFPARAEWPCVQNGPNLEPGDVLFLYRGDVGIFAAGTIDDARPSKRSTPGGAPMWMIDWRLDDERTRRLVAVPVSAEFVRKHVHPRVTVRNFTAGARALRKRLS